MINISLLTLDIKAPAWKCENTFFVLSFTTVVSLPKIVNRYFLISWSERQEIVTLFPRFCWINIFKIFFIILEKFLRDKFFGLS